MRSIIGLTALITLSLFTSLVGAAEESSKKDLRQAETAVVIAKQYIPFLRMGPGAWTGIALSNTGDTAAQVRMTAYGLDGKALELEKNPTELILPARAQLARLAKEYFESPGSKAEGWIELEMDSDDVLAFYQAGNDRVTKLDGALAARVPTNTFSFSRLYSRAAGAESTFSVINVSDYTSQVSLRLSTQGRSYEVNRFIPGKRGIRGTVEEIWGQRADKDSYIVVRTNGTTYSLVGGQFTESRNTLVMTSGSRQSRGNEALHSAQIVLGDEYRTSVTLLNELVPQEVRISAYDDAGNLLAPTVERAMYIGENFEADLGELFGLTDLERIVAGSLVVEPEKPGMTGNVHFGIDGRLGALQQLQPGSSREFHLSQVANGAGAYTGIAMQNQGDEPLAAELAVYDVNGEETASALISLAPKARRARLLPELAPDSAGQVGGRVKITADGPLSVQQLFGDTSLHSLSSVPAVAKRENPPLDTDGHYFVTADVGGSDSPGLRVHQFRRIDGEYVRVWTSEPYRMPTDIVSPGSTRLGDVDGDGVDELVLVSPHTHTYLTRAGSRGEPDLEQQLQEGTRLMSALLGDVDNDGVDELVTSGADIRIYDWNGKSFKLQWTSETYNRYWQFWYPTIGDPDGDGLNELVTPIVDQGLRIYDNHTANGWSFRLAEGLSGKGGITLPEDDIRLNTALVTDINPRENDGLEILVSGNIKRLVLYKHNKRTQEYEIQAITEEVPDFTVRATAADLDGNGIRELVTGNMRFTVFRYDKESWNIVDKRLPFSPFAFQEIHTLKQGAQEKLLLFPHDGFIQGWKILEETTDEFRVTDGDYYGAHTGQIRYPHLDE